MSLEITGWQPNAPVVIIAAQSLKVKPKNSTTGRHMSQDGSPVGWLIPSLDGTQVWLRLEIDQGLGERWQVVADTPPLRFSRVNYIALDSGSKI